MTYEVWIKDNAGEKKLAASGITRRSAERVVASFLASNIPARYTKVDSDE